MKQDDLLVDYCSYKAANYAVMNWHYSKKMPKSKLVKFGVWWNGEFFGSVIYGRGANKNIGSPYGLEMTECSELVRVAIKDGHDFMISKVVSTSVKMLKTANRGLRLLVSYADTEQQHIGTIYQAMNWIYTGAINPPSLVNINGVYVHTKTASGYGSTSGKQTKQGSVKHKYLYPLDKNMRRQILPLSQPYPKRADN